MQGIKSRLTHLETAFILIFGIIYFKIVLKVKVVVATTSFLTYQSLS